VAIAYTIRYGREKSTVAALFPVSDEESLISSDGGSVSTTGGGRAAMVPSEDVSIVRFSVGFGGPVRSL
jgi:hypothetical protein